MVQGYYINIEMIVESNASNCNDAHVYVIFLDKNYSKVDVEDKCSKLGEEVPIYLLLTMTNEVDDAVC